jgi:hypothetical protein
MFLRVHFHFQEMQDGHFWGKPSSNFNFFKSSQAKEETHSRKDVERAGLRNKIKD